MAFRAGSKDIGRVGAGGRVTAGQHRVGGVAVGASRGPLGRAKAVVLPVIALHVGLYGHFEDLVALHHLGVAMTLQADLGVKLAVGMVARGTQGFYVVQVVTVVAGRRITISRGDSLSMGRFPVGGLLVVAGETPGNNDALVLVPVGVGMDVRVAAGAADAAEGVYTGIMFRILPLVTALTLHFLDLDLLFHVPDEIGNVRVAAGTGVFAMDRCGKILD